MDGMTVLQQMRGKHSCGLLVVTGRSDTHDRVMGLESWAPTTTWSSPSSRAS